MVLTPREFSQVSATLEDSGTKGRLRLLGCVESLAGLRVRLLSHEHRGESGGGL